MLRLLDLVYKKRDGHTLSKEEIQFFVDGVTNDKFPDYQIVALLMAIYFRGLNPRETSDLTMAMAASGEQMDLSAIDGLKLDKHSTGGVGDKCTLIVVPIVASLGLKMAKLSGRGLGFTGGTIDKLESISGLTCDLDTETFMKQVREINLVVAGQTANLCPCDKRLYALRDVSATVDNESLIAASVMSKKIAGGADKILLDITCGSGAFMKDLASARSLAKLMVEIGKLVNREVRCLITNMNEPLGVAVGNRIEVEEACEVLQNRGPEDTREVCKNLAAHLLSMNNFSDDFNVCLQAVETQLANGKAYQKFIEFLQAQHAIIHNNKPVFRENAKYKRSVLAPKNGYIVKLQADKIGLAAQALGGGRIEKEDIIESACGIMLYKKVGDYVEAGTCIADILYNDEEKFNRALNFYNEALCISDTKVEHEDIILDIVR